MGKKNRARITKVLEMLYISHSSPSDLFNLGFSQTTLHCGWLLPSYPSGEGDKQEVSF